MKNLLLTALLAFSAQGALAFCSLEVGKEYQISYEVDMYDNNQFVSFFGGTVVLGEGDRVKLVKRYRSGELVVQRVTKPEAVIQYDESGNAVGCSIKSNPKGRLGYLMSRDCSALN